MKPPKPAIMAAILTTAFVLSVAGTLAIPGFFDTDLTTSMRQIPPDPADPANIGHEP